MVSYHFVLNDIHPYPEGTQCFFPFIEDLPVNYSASYKQKRPDVEGSSKMFMISHPYRLRPNNAIFDLYSPRGSLQPSG
jgi:hypothetical protein